MKPETKQTFKVAVTLCLVCSIVVSSLAVGLKGIQEEQKEAFRQQSILAAAGLWEDGANPGELYKDYITPVGVDLEDYKPEEGELSDAKFDMAKSLQDPDLNRPIEKTADIAGLKKMEKYSVVYQVRNSEGQLTTLVLPIRGRGLWSTLYGFVALDMTDSADPSKIRTAGLTYYKHGETPGLGGEVDNALWKQKWRLHSDDPSKDVYPFDENWKVVVEVSKNATTQHQVDALSGATLTSNGVTNMLRFWLGPDGFGPYLKNVAAAKTPTEAQTASLTDTATQ